MKKVLVVYEDITEGTRVQAYLKKIGLDAFEIGNEFLLAEQLLAFRPDVIVVNGGNQKKVSTLSIGQKLRENSRYQGKVILIFPQGKPLSPSDLSKVRADILLEAPVDPARLIQGLAKLMSLDAQLLLEKFSRTPFAMESSKTVVGSQAGSKPQGHDWMRVKDADRMKRYEQYVSGMKIDKEKTSYSSQSIKKAQKEFTQEWDEQKRKELEDLDKQKREFATALFRKGSNGTGKGD